MTSSPTDTRTPAQNFIHPVQAECPQGLLAAARERGRLNLLVVRASAPLPMEAAFHAYQAGIAQPVLVGEADRIEAEAATLGWDLSDITVIDSNGEAEAAAKAASLLQASLSEPDALPIGAVMKGQLHTDVFMAALLNREVGLRIGNRLVHIFAIYPPDSGAGPVLVSDAAVNVTPDEKTQNQSMIEMCALAKKLGHMRPKLAILSATETPIDSMPASMVAAERAKWAKAHLVDTDISGPLSFDLALSAHAVATKGITGDAVAGRANCLLVPDIVSGNILYKALVYLGGGCAAGIVLGGAVPILLTSRADPPAARLASIALAGIAG
ncbi:MAG: phosphate acetyltransferase [Proteobacteria bacterium]|nr:phosphate acetyltransferase [Pseudomonadota bacterium]